MVPSVTRPYLHFAQRALYGENDSDVVSSVVHAFDEVDESTWSEGASDVLARVDHNDGAPSELNRKNLVDC
jgi:hypothetical protein